MKISELKKQAKLVHSLNSVSPKKQMHIMKNLDPAALTFLTKCMSCVLNGSSSNLKLKPNQRKLAQRSWEPYKKEMKKIANTKNHAMVVKRIRRQTGEGFILSAILSAAIPLISTLIQKAFTKKK